MVHSLDLHVLLYMCCQCPLGGSHSGSTCLALYVLPVPIEWFTLWIYVYVLLYMCCQCPLSGSHSGSTCLALYVLPVPIEWFTLWIYMSCSICAASAHWVVHTLDLHVLLYMCCQCPLSGSISGYTCLALYVLPVPIEWFTLWIYMPYMMLFSDIRQGLFNTVLLSFWIIFTGEHMMVRGDQTASYACMYSYWTNLSIHS